MGKQTLILGTSTRKCLKSKHRASIMKYFGLRQLCQYFCLQTYCPHVGGSQSDSLAGQTSLLEKEVKTSWYILFHRL